MAEGALRIEFCVPGRCAFDTARAYFASHLGAHGGRIEVSNASIVHARHAAVVAAGNSFAEMNGGVDGIINTHLSSRVSGGEPAYVQDEVKRVLRDRFAGELPVGQSVVVRTSHPVHATLVYAPTMRVAEDVAGTLNAYLAFRGALLAMRSSGIPAASTPLFCTGAGGMDVRTACFQMMEAWRTVEHGTLIGGDWPSFHRHHRMLLGGGV
jgi:O-acetyl-ADP-ribose deacetylase (regulator of RNase III)